MRTPLVTVVVWRTSKSLSYNLGVLSTPVRLSLCCFNAKGNGSRVSGKRWREDPRRLPGVQHRVVRISERRGLGRPPALQQRPKGTTGSMKVMHSPLPARLGAEPRDVPGSRVFQDDRHSVVTFHDSTFECLCRVLRMALDDGAPEEGRCLVPVRQSGVSGSRWLGSLDLLALVAGGHYAVVG